MKGNEAIAEAAIRAGCRNFFGYPITPQTEVSAYMAKKMAKAGGTFLQAESEIAAINMVYGAAAAGYRTMTSSSSPGISLKAEGISYIVGAELPCVIMNVQRGGPGLGGIQPSQADYFQATRGPGHGDMHVIVIAPSTVQEMVDMIYEGFDIADIYRNPVMILVDGVLGQMMEPVQFDRKSERALPAKDWATTGHGDKRPPNIVNSLYLQPAALEKHIQEIFAKYKKLEEEEIRFEEEFIDDAEIVVVAYGATARVARNAVKAARAKGIKAGLFRPITLWPFPNKRLRELADKTGAFLAVEMSMGQMVEDVKLATEFKKPIHFFGRTGGIIPTPDEVLSKIEKIARGEK